MDRNITYCKCGHSVSQHGNEYIGMSAGSDCQAITKNGRCSCKRWQRGETRRAEDPPPDAAALM